MRKIVLKKGFSASITTVCGWHSSAAAGVSKYLTSHMKTAGRPAVTFFIQTELGVLFMHIEHNVRN